MKGLRLVTSENSIQRLLGEPKSTSVGWGEDDGGRHQVKTYHYEDLEVDAVRGNVDRIYTNSDNVITPFGIRPGQNMRKVLEILGGTPRDWILTDTTFDLVTCPVDGRWIQEDYVTFEFDGNDILISVEFAVNRP